MRNLITDVRGVRVGNAEDARLASGVTVIVFDAPAVASVSVRGGAPGARDTALLDPSMTVERVDAIVLSGGSAFGLDAAGGVQAALRAMGAGFAVGGMRVPIVPQAIVFDLLNGGDKDWGDAALLGSWPRGRPNGSARTFALGTAGGGYGATTATLKGGLGSASATTSTGPYGRRHRHRQCHGQATVGDSGHFWAAPYEQDGEFGGLGWPPPCPHDALACRIKGHQPATTIALVATDAALTKPQAHRLAIMADDGLARAIRPAHAPLDGDTVFAAATGHRPLADRSDDLTELGHVAADCLARAIARGVYEATALPFAGALPDWKSRFAKR
jgi:L-aminopeptidase/D-esterase-like protein